jgi:hypothetical protein
MRKHIRTRDDAPPVVGSIRSRLGAVSDWAEPFWPNKYVSFCFFYLNKFLDVHKFNLNEI